MPQNHLHHHLPQRLPPIKHSLTSLTGHPFARVPAHGLTKTFFLLVLLLLLLPFLYGSTSQYCPSPPPTPFKLLFSLRFFSSPAVLLALSKLTFVNFIFSLSPSSSITSLPCLSLHHHLHIYHLSSPHIRSFWQWRLTILLIFLTKKNLKTLIFKPCTSSPSLCYCPVMEDGVFRSELLDCMFSIQWMYVNKLIYSLN